MTSDRNSMIVLTMNTLAFTVCFAVWMLNGVLVTFLVDNGVFDWSPVEIGWLFGIPILTGAIFRLPAGILTDKFGGKPVFSILLFLCAIPLFLLSRVDSFIGFAIYSFGFGLCGVSFANSFYGFIIASLGFGISGAGFVVGIKMVANWFPPKMIGRAEGFYAGWGNFGSAWAAMTLPWIAIMMH